MRGAVNKYSIKEMLRSQENANTVRGMYEAFAAGEVPKVLAALDPQVQWWEAENFIYDDGILTWDQLPC
jgi:ketosteroid isomerase-like protein